MALIEVAPLASLGPVLPLRRDSRADGHGFVERLFADWDDGAERFAGPGEVLLAARIDGTMAGIGGLCRDPFAGDPRIGRIRHLYVASACRGLGVGRALLAALVDEARGRFAVLRLVTDNPAADALYRAAGFAAVPGERQTHRLML